MRCPARKSSVDRGADPAEVPTDAPDFAPPAGGVRRVDYSAILKIAFGSSIYFVWFDGIVVTILLIVG